MNIEAASQQLKSLGLGQVQLFLLAMGTSHACGLSALPQIPSSG